jgi:hypothetical protein
MGSSLFGQQKRSPVAPRNHGLMWDMCNAWARGLAFALNQVLTLLLRPKLLFSLHWFWFLFCTKQMIRTYLWHLPALANHKSVVAHFCPFRRIVIVVLTRTRAKTAVRLLAGCSRAGMAQACWWRYDTDDPASNHQRFQVFMIGFVRYGSVSKPCTPGEHQK